jgi:hypothetical protein
LREAHRILAANGSFFLHLDYREVHYAKVLMDQIFGRENFMNEIIWSYDYGARSRSRWSCKHDNILWYVKDHNNYVFNYDAIDRIPYMAPDLVGEEKAAKGKTPTDVWWNTIVPTNGKERCGYPTQKPLNILNRIVTIHSTLDVSSSNYSVTASGSWLNNGGIFTARSGTVTLNGAGRQTVQGGGSSFSTLRILSSSGTTLTDSITVGSALTIGAGAVLSVPTYSLTATNATITNAGTIRQTSGGKIVHTGAVSVSPSSVTPGGSISITVNDSDANTDGTAADTLTAYVRSESEDMTLTETSASSGLK